MSRWLRVLFTLGLLGGCEASAPVPLTEGALIDASEVQSVFTLDLGVAALAVGSSYSEWPEDVDAQVQATPPRVTPNYFILAPADWSEVANAYGAHRRADGYEVLWIEPLSTPAETLNALHEAQRESRAERPDEPLFVLIIGDERGPFPAAECENDLGACYTDRGYGSDDNVIVGRLPAEAPQQALEHLEKIQSHEAQYHPGPWNRRLVLYIGISNSYSGLNEMFEDIIIQGVTEVDHAFDITAVYNAPYSPFFYTPFKDKVVELINGGALFAIYVGDAGPQTTIGLDIDNASEIACLHRAPFMFLFSSSTGAYYYAEEEGVEGEEPPLQETIARALLWRPLGPLTVVGGGGITHPYANAIWPYELQREALSQCPKTIGEAMLLTRAAIRENDDEFRDSVTSIAMQVGLHGVHLSRVIEQHLDLYNLYGDPATALRCPPHRISLRLIEGGFGAGFLRVEGRVRGINAGRALISLEVERDTIPGTLEAIDTRAPDPEAVARNWATANDRRHVEGEIEFEGGRFQARITIGEDLLDVPYYLKVFAYDDERDAVGSMLIPR